MARSGPADAGGEAAGKGLGASDGPSIPFLGPPPPVPRRSPSSSRPAAPLLGDPRPPQEPDAVSATSSAASGRGPRRIGHATRPAPRPHATLPPGLGGPSPAAPFGRRSRNICAEG